MPSLFEELMHRYGWIWVGLTFGFGAKYALLIKRGVRVQAKLVCADLLLLPMVALIAFWLVSLAGVRGEAAALFASLCTVGADRLVKLLTDRFVARVDSEVPVLAAETIGAVRQQVQAERSGEAVIGDTIAGRAVERYRALDPHPQAPKKD